MQRGKKYYGETYVKWSCVRFHTELMSIVLLCYWTSSSIVRSQPDTLYVWATSPALPVRRDTVDGRSESTRVNLVMGRLDQCG